MKQTILLILIVLILTSCAPEQQPTADAINTLPPDTAVTSPPEQTPPANEPTQDRNPFAPRPGDANFSRADVFVQEASLLIRESFPPQIALSLKGELPTPCHQLRVQIGAPDSNNKISIEVYSVVNPDMMCTQVVKPFEENVELGTFPSGHYSVFVNEELVGEFDS
jgi:hypothetical protein